MQYLLSPMPFPQFSFSLANICRHTVCTHLLYIAGRRFSVLRLLFQCSFFSLLSSVTFCVRMPFLALETIGPITKGLLSSTTPSLSHSLFPHVCIILHYAFSPFFSVPSSSFLCLTMAWKRRGLYTFIFLEKWLLIVFLKQEKVVCVCAHNTFYFTFTKKSIMILKMRLDAFSHFVLLSSEKCRLFWSSSFKQQ